jgi:malate synthase
VDAVLARFVEDEALPGTGIEAGTFWTGLAGLLADFAPKNRALLAKRDELQAKIDAWHIARRGQPHDHAAYKAFLAEIGYLLPEGPAFTIETTNVDPEVAKVPGPQLVVPVTNARYALNAANARWGSLYDCLYGTDAMGSLPPAGGYERGRGARVVARARVFLDEAFPIAGTSHADVRRYAVKDGALLVDDLPLVDPSKFVGYRGNPKAPDAVLLRNNGLHVELVFDRAHFIGSRDQALLADVQLESALTAIMDCEDSVACVDAEDKVGAYRNWLGLMQGNLSEVFEKGGRHGRAAAGGGPGVSRPAGQALHPDQGPRADVGAQRRPSDDQPGDPVAGRLRGARGPDGRDGDGGDRAARPEEDRGDAELGPGLGLCGEAEDARARGSGLRRRRDGAGRGGAGAARRRR